MTETLWIVLSLAVLALAAMLILRKRLKRTKLKVPGASLELHTHDRSITASGGATMEDVKAGGSARNEDRTGQGASMRGVEAGGDVENTSSRVGGPKRPKA